jgi:hypothetical protein
MDKSGRMAPEERRVDDDLPGLPGTVPSPLRAAPGRDNAGPLSDEPSCDSCALRLHCDDCAPCDKFSYEPGCLG